MLPAIFPRDQIHVRPAQRADLVLGTIICFPNARKEIVAHRIVGAAVRDGELCLEVRGDAHKVSEWMLASAAAYVVVAVDGRMGRWTAVDWRGRLLKRWALSSGRLPRALRLATASGLRWAAALRASLRA